MTNNKPREERGMRNKHGKKSKCKVVLCFNCEQADYPPILNLLND